MACLRGKNSRLTANRIKAYRRADKVLWVAESVGLRLAVVVGKETVGRAFLAVCVVLSPLSAWKSVLYHRLPKRMRGEIFDRAICSRHEHLPYAEFLFFTVFALAGIAVHLMK